MKLNIRLLCLHSGIKVISDKKDIDGKLIREHKSDELLCTKITISPQKI